MTTSLQAASPPGSAPPKHPCTPGSPPLSSATTNSPTTTPGSAGNSPTPSASRGRPGPDQVTIQAGEAPQPDSARPVNDTVHDRKPQVTALPTSKAQDNTRIQWRYL